MSLSAVYEQSLREEIDQIVRQCQELAVAGQFAAAIMHEINSPLEAITNLSYLIQREVENPVQVLEYCQLLDEQLLTLTKLSRQTLSFFKAPEAVQVIAISALAEAALRVHNKNIVAKQIKLRKKLLADVTVEVNPGAMLQVFSNLVANALDALPAKGVLAISMKRGAAEVHVTVADNGPGIPSSVLPRIFDPFFTTKEERGTGLGLAISKAIVERHNGRIRTRSTTSPKRNGTAFRVSIPFTGRSAAAR
jgi:signal transduction histidine kinase